MAMGSASDLTDVTVLSNSCTERDMMSFNKALSKVGNPSDCRCIRKDSTAAEAIFGCLVDVAEISSVMTLRADFLDGMLRSMIYEVCGSFNAFLLDIDIRVVNTFENISHDLLFLASFEAIPDLRGYSNQAIAAILPILASKLRLEGIFVHVCVVSIDFSISSHGIIEVAELPRPQHLQLSTPPLIAPRFSSFFVSLQIPSKK
eukprot:768473-Hanusia_phi.AAC.3